jgi:hypothetical protein
MESVYWITRACTCVKHNFKSVHVSNLFWSREYNSAMEICKYPSFSKVGDNYDLDRWNCQELKYRIFRSAIIHVLAHFQRTTCSQIYFRFSSYLLCKPHLFVILTAIGWFIVRNHWWHYQHACENCRSRQAKHKIFTTFY